MDRERRRVLRAVGAGAAAATLAGCGGANGSDDAPDDSSAATGTIDSPTTDPGDHGGSPPGARFRLRDGAFQVRNDDGWSDRLLRGVNLGMGKPGTFPGEAAITRSEYDRWLARIHEMNANAVRVYTVHPPAFYEALSALNERVEDPLYLFHGNWLPAHLTEGETTAFDDELTAVFDRGLREAIDVVHGNATLPDRPGHAAGAFTADVSPYTMGYVAGVEWEPQFVLRTNEHHDGGATDGRYVEATADAAAFERWLARRLDRALTHEAEAYGTTRPASISNWPTTDHLDHPAEPLAWEDRASVNPNALASTRAHSPGLFATYHAYPYYPDFLNFSEEYLREGEGAAGSRSYRAYLEDLRENLRHPLVIGEFGVPASRGTAHEQVDGFDQGHHTETRQGELDAALFADIVESGAAGGIVFAWQDEWFKRTWNTMRYTDPNRRPEWLNDQSPEERFGLLSFDPAGRVTLSGDAEEWAGATIVSTGGREPRVALDDGYDAGRSLREVRATADPAALSVRIEYEELGETVDWDRMRTVLGFDLVPDRGNTALPRGLILDHAGRADVVVELAGPDASRAWVASHADRFYYEYGETGGYLPTRPYASTPDNGVYHPIRLAVSYPLDLPTQGRTVSFRSVETGQLRYGIGDPDSSKYDSLTDVHVDAAANTIELRLPWCLLGFRDPSSAVMTGDIWTDGLGATRPVDDVGIAALTYAPDADGDARTLSGRPNATDTLPAAVSGTIPADAGRFSLDTWNDPETEERLKESYDVLQDAFERYG
ncbi:hypothetical protein GRX01_03330 [Halobaculum sp. WSA2]|uniref:Uncharacterized protein n=1 Tax=Halobaculum saliterrae TaxID=2073113 RepID=A0A6B0T1B2_9EURY|nr:hypothetical protein [Halobaculum saliterrae]MXR40389.1 hypothetical protein [Halobaculum saliterrae]